MSIAGAGILEGSNTLSDTRLAAQGLITFFMDNCIKYLKTAIVIKAPDSFGKYDD